MEVCQHCEMYMKPFISDDCVKCEFCGEAIAIKKDGKWSKVDPIIS